MNDELIGEFVCFVDLIEGDMAHITINTETGEVLHGEISALKLRSKGIKEHRRFKARLIDRQGLALMFFEPIPDKEISSRREQEIDNELDKLGDK